MLRFACSRIAVSYRHQSLSRHVARAWASSSAQGKLEAFDNSPVLQVVRRKMDQRSELQLQITDSMSPSQSKHVMKQLTQMEPLSSAWDEWLKTRECLRETDTLLEDSDPSMRSLAEEEHERLTNILKGYIDNTFPSLLVPPSSTSHLSAMMELKAGVGGSEAALFLAEIMRMYVRLANSMGWKTNIIASNDTENGGIKDAIVEIQGQKAYDTLRWESGVHRVQRVPETEANGRVHTSTVAVVVLPLVEERGSSESSDDLFSLDDVRIEVMRSRGAGGQHVNKTESAVRLTHIPTGITVSMQDERSQHQNKRRAFQVLRARLLDRKLSQEVVDRRDARRNLVQSADRSEKIRTYNYAQDRVTDHRIGYSLKNLDAVLEGDALQDIIDVLVRKHRDDLLADAIES